MHIRLPRRALPAGFALMGLLAGCAEPGAIVYPAYPAVPYGAGPLPAPVPLPNGAAGSPAGGAAEGATTGVAPEIPPATIAPAGPPVQTEALPQSTPAAPATPAPPASSGPATDQPDRFQSLKNSLQQSTSPTTPVATTPAATPAAPAAANGCTNVHTRAGFHDHYGGLNSAGDVRPSCN